MDQIDTPSCGDGAFEDRIRRQHERRGDYIQTYSGHKFWPLDPRPEEIAIVDIAAALSKVCRFGGHCIRFYSVAEHCVHIAAHAPPRCKLEALMHDASEAYLSDIVRPVKVSLPEYRAMERHLEECIAKRFKLQYPWPKAVKVLDERILRDERAQLMMPTDWPWSACDNEIEPLGIELPCWTPEAAGVQFLVAFYEYYAKANGGAAWV